jgi:hypothetical protein
MLIEALFTRPDRNLHVPYAKLIPINEYYLLSESQKFGLLASESATVLQRDDSECSKFELFLAFPTGNGLLFSTFRPTFRMPYYTPITGVFMRNCAFYDLTNLTLNYLMLSEKPLSESRI